MKLIKFSVEHSLFVNFLSVVIIIWGVISLFSLQRDAFPNVNFGIVSVSTIYPGASPEEVEKLITIPIEKELRKVNGIDEIVSASQEGISVIFITIDPDEDQQFRVVNDIQRAVDRVPDYPSDLQDKPVVYEFRTKDRAILQVSLFGDIPEEQIIDHAEILEEKLLDIEEVAGIDRSGWRDKQIWVEADPKKMDEYLVSLSSVIQALKTHNVFVPGGKIDTGKEDYIVRTTGEFETADEIKQVIIRSNDFGNPVRVKDIAEVTNRLEEEAIIIKTDGSKAINLIVRKKEKADAIDLVAGIKKVVDEYRGQVEGLKIKYVNDFSYFVERRLNILTTNSYVGFFLVLFALFLLLSPTVAFLTALGIPISFFITFIVMNGADISINLISMFGIITVLGMLVDDAIIISENIYRHVEKGMPVKEAAVYGGSQVVKPVFAAVLTTITAFSPLFFISGITGKFIMNIPLAVTIALVASLLEAFLILPSHVAEFVKPPKNVNGHLKTKRDAWLFRNLLGTYTKLLNGALKYRYVVLPMMAIILAGGIFLSVKVLKFNLFPSKGIEAFFIRAEAPIGTPLSKTNELIIPIEKEIIKLPDTELKNFVTTVGSVAQDETDPLAREGSHLVQIIVYLTPTNDRERDVPEIIDEVRAATKDVKGFEKISFESFKTGPPVGKAVSINIKGEDLKVSREIAGLFLKRMEQMKGVLDPDEDFQEGKEEIRVVVDEAKAKSAFLTIADIAASVRFAFEGGIATKIKKSKEEIEVVVKFHESEANDMKAFDKIKVPNMQGNLIPLKSVASLEKTRGIFSIKHMDTKRSVTVTASVDERITSSVAVNTQLAEEFKDIPVKYPGYTIKYGGEFEETQKSINDILRAFFISFLLIFMILASTFNSLIQPLIIMASIPFGLIGVLVMLLSHGEELSFMVLIGVVGLSGVVINSSIVLVDFINNARLTGMSRRESIVEAGRTRLRPILLTSFTTMLGLVSVAYGIGGADPFLMPMAKGLVWGLLFNTGLTLIMIPCIYAMVDDINGFLWKVFRKKQKYPGNNIKAVKDMVDKKPE